jgi:hypothetical protein
MAHHRVGRLEGLLDAVTLSVIEPAMVGAADATAFQEAIVQRSAPVSAVFLHEAVRTVGRSEQNELLTHDLDPLFRMFLGQLADCGRGLPVAA